MQLHQDKADETEQRRRRELNHDTRVGIALGISPEQVAQRREQSAFDWMGWLSQKMVEQRADDPQSILHLICARLEERGALLGARPGKIAQAHQWPALGL
jgi:hypothetical protein